MPNGRGRKSKPIRLTICEDPALFRYASLQEALSANKSSIARLIRIGEKKSQISEDEKESQETTSVIKRV